jgi:hypothetical protein
MMQRRAVDHLRIGERCFLLKVWQLVALRRQDFGRNDCSKGGKRKASGSMHAWSSGHDTHTYTACED